MLHPCWKRPVLKRRRILFEQLEERIVLDATVANTASEQNHEDNPTVAQQTDQDGDTAAQQGDTTPAGSGTTDSSDPLGEVFNQDLGEVLISAGLDNIESGSAAEGEVAQEAIRVLVISSSVEGADQLAEAAQDGVLTLIYDGNGDTLETILTSIADALNGREAHSIAFATHDLGEACFHLTGGYSVSPGTLSADTEVQSFWEGVGDLLADDGRIDLLACELAATEAGGLLISLLEDVTGHAVAASDDPTGNSDDNGDWVLERGDVDLAATYFVWSGLQDFQGTLTGMSKITAYDGYQNSNFGNAVSIDGNYAIVGAIYDTDDGAPYCSGSAYIYEQDGAGTWTFKQKLVATDQLVQGRFGYSVAIHGNYAVVGTIRDTVQGPNTGTAYIYERDLSGNWILDTKLYAGDGATSDYFGASVAIDNGYVIVGAHGDDDQGESSGSAYIYKLQQSGNWSQITKLTAGDGEAYDYFGSSVAICGSYAIVGAYGDDDQGESSGSAYIYKLQQSGNWGNETKLTASDGEAYDYFGESVAITDNFVYKSGMPIREYYAVVGAYGDDRTDGDDYGAAYVYELGLLGNWGNETKLVASDAQPGDRFGDSVSMGDDYVFIGASMDDDHGVNSGSTYLYVRGGVGVWGSETKLIADDVAGGDEFGGSVSISGNYAIVGAKGDDDLGWSAGAVYCISFTFPTVDLDESAYGTGYAVMFTEDAGPVNISDLDVLITDPDDTNVESVTATITNGLDGAYESLSFSGTLPSNLQLEPYDPVTGELRITGTGTLAEYQAAIAQIQYNNLDDDPDTADRIIEVVVNDGVDDGNRAISTVSITPVNDAPIVDLDASDAGTGYAVTFTEDAGPVNISNDDALIADPDDTNIESLTVTLTNRPDGVDESLSLSDPLLLAAGLTLTEYDSATGVLRITGAGTLAEYEAAIRLIQYNNSDQDPDPIDRIITVVVNDGDEDGNTAVSTVSITPVNDAPTLDLDVIKAGTGYAVTFTEDAGPVDISNDDVLITDLDDTNIESLTVTLTNRPDGADESLSLSDPLLLAAGLTLTEYDPATGVLRITGTGTFAEYEAAIELIQYNNSDQDPDSTNRIINVVINDGDDNGDIAVSMVSIIPVNDAPTTSGLVDVSVREDAANTVFSLYPSYFDADDIDARLTYTVETITNAHLFASVDISDPTNFTLDYAPDAHGTADITIRATDAGGLWVEDTFRVTIKAVNDLPVLTAPTSVNVDEDTSVTISGLFVWDVDSTHPVPPTATYRVAVTLSVEHGTLTLAEGHGIVITSGADGSADVTFIGTPAEVNAALSGLIYAPDGNYHGSDSLQITIDDQGNFGSGGPRLLDHAIPVTVASIPEFDEFGKPQTADSSTLTDGLAVEPLSTVGSIRAIDNLMELLSSQGLIPASFGLLEGVGSGYESIPSAEFQALLLPALFGETPDLINQAWENLSWFLDQGKNGEPELLPLEQFLDRLRQWQVGKTMDEILLVLNAEQIKLAEWFDSAMASSKWLNLDHRIESALPEGSVEPLAQAKSVVFNLDEISVAHLLRSESGNGLFDGINGTSTQPLLEIAKVFDLSHVSFIDALTR